MGEGQGESGWRSDCVGTSAGSDGGETGEYVDAWIAEGWGRGGCCEYVCWDGDGDGWVVCEGVDARPWSREPDVYKNRFIVFHRKSRARASRRK